MQYSDVLIPLILGLTESVKQCFPNSRRFAPIIAILLGVGLHLPINTVWTLPGALKAVLQGVVYGLAASGLWSSAKHVLKFSKGLASPS